MTLEKHQEGYLINGVLALLKQKDIELLTEYTKKIEKPNCYVEIGTHLGGSAILASENTDVPIYSIDPTNKKTKELSENPRFNFIHKESLYCKDDVKDPIGLLFIDGDHFIAGKDFEAWKDKVVKGGYIIFHDYVLHPEWSITKECNSIIEKYKDEYKVIFKPVLDTGWRGQETSILVLQKI